MIHLKIKAITNVMAGKTLHIAAANVAVVFFIPIIYKFWSITGLQIKRQISYYMVIS